MKNQSDILNRQAAAGTATTIEISSEINIIQLKNTGKVLIDNETEGYQIDGPATILVLKVN